MSADAASPSDDVRPVATWDMITNKYKVAQMCDQEIARLDAVKDAPRREQLQRERVLAVATAVEELGKLSHRETRAQLKEFARRDAGGTESLVIPPSTLFLSSRDPLF